jgi:hypothetical protein
MDLLRKMGGRGCEFQFPYPFLTFLGLGVKEREG